MSRESWHLCGYNQGIYAPHQSANPLARIPGGAPSSHLSPHSTVNTQQSVRLDKPHSRRQYSVRGPAFAIMKILVTGAAGYIGQILSEALLNAGHSVVMADIVEPLVPPGAKSAQNRATLVQV